jgi:hypothetical protein
MTVLVLALLLTFDTVGPMTGLSFGFTLGPSTGLSFGFTLGPSTGLVSGLAIFLYIINISILIWI